MAIRERLDTLSRGELAGLAVLVIAVLAGAGLWYARSIPKPVQVVETPAAGLPVAGGTVAAAAPGGSGSATPSAGAPVELIVDVAGWVRHPGVYQFDPGARIVDAVERAGGARENADLTLLNLAAPLTDGQQVLVPKEGAVTATLPSGTVPVGGTTLVNINTADATALEGLNGIGESLAAAIIQYRTDNGPFTSVDQLDEVSGIGPATLEKLRPFVTI
jgi:competence protein ComEA